MPIYIHRSSIHKFDAYQSIQAITDGDVLFVGHQQFQVIHTPGHSPDGVCFYSEGHLITGDTLFINRCGRADFEDSNVHDLYQSLQQLKQLPDDTVIYPGHNMAKTPTDTIKNQCLSNPYLLAVDEESFIRLRMGR
jgi:Zn-dependent hydrolases, including glyoxylases